MNPWWLRVRIRVGRTLRMGASRVESRTWLLMGFVLAAVTSVPYLFFKDPTKLDPLTQAAFIASGIVAGLVHVAWNVRSGKRHKALETQASREKTGPSGSGLRQTSIAPAPHLAHPHVTTLTFGDVLFWHHYEPPRGPRTTPLAEWPVWSPIAERVEEVLTLTQVVTRTLGSSREPFRRTQLVIPDPSIYSQFFRNIASWAIRNAQASVGASLLPIALSLKKLARGLERPVQLAASPVDGIPDHLDRDAVDRCTEILTIASLARLDEPQTLTATLIAGNGWLLVHDDCEFEIDARRTAAALDKAFSAKGFSRIPILIVTCRNRSRLFEDIQVYRVTGPSELQKMDRRATGFGSELAERLCRPLAFVTSPPWWAAISASLVFAGIALSLRYSVPVAAWHLMLVFEGVPGLLALLAFAGAGILGSAWGSEEIRRTGVEAMLVTYFAGCVGALALLVLSFPPATWNTIVHGVLSVGWALLVGLASAMVFSTVGCFLWLLSSTRILRTFDASLLRERRWRNRFVLHIAVQNLTMKLNPNDPVARDPIPLLVSRRTRFIFNLLVEANPSLASTLADVAFEAMRSQSPDDDKSARRSYSATSLILDAVKLKPDVGSMKCVRRLLEACLPERHNREDFQLYKMPSYSFHMTMPEYVCRHLCYMADVGELVLVQ
jgi:hypothetical protein